VTENERPLLPVHQNILAASPYVIVHTARNVKQHASPLSLPAPNIRHQAQCDPGVNISETNNILVLRDTVDLKTPFPISSSDRTAPAMTASILGMFVLPFSDGSTCDIPMYYCPSLADTIVSLHHFTSSAIVYCRYNGYCLINIPGIILSHWNDNDTSCIALNKSKDLYFISGSTPDSLGSRVSRLATKPQLLSELWHQRLGHPGPTQLGALAKHSTGLPSLITMHPMHLCQACYDEKIQRADKGPISDTGLLLPGTRFHLDFGFIRALSADFGVTMGNRVVTSYDGNNLYLIIVCAKTRQTWVFFQASKSPPIFIIERFLASNGLKAGPCYLCMDQGGELWRSNELRYIDFAAGCDFEPTGSDAASDNGKV
jgi:hypothetical protein